MKAHELYELLDDAGVDYEIVEIIEGIRYLLVMVEDEHDD